MEIWKDIKEYEGIYQVSNFGKVKSKRKILIPAKGEYLKVSLSKNGTQKTRYIHRLVAETFLDNKSNLPFVNHKDENRYNNNVNNLEWCTNKYNINYGNAQKKKAKSQLRYNIIQKDIKGNIVNIWESASQVADCLKLNKGTIRKSCKTGLKNYGYYWEYKKVNL